MVETRTVALLGLGALLGGGFIYAWAKGMIPQLPPLMTPQYIYVPTPTPTVARPVMSELVRVS